MTDLEITKITLKKFGIKFHEIVEGEYTYIQTFAEKDENGKLFVNGYGLIELKKSGQLLNFMEFRNGKIASY